MNFMRSALIMVALAIGAESAHAASQSLSQALSDKEIIGRQVVDPTGKTVGDVVSVIKANDGSLTSLVVKSGGKDIALPIAQTTLEGDVVRTTQPAEEVAKRPSMEERRSN